MENILELKEHKKIIKFNIWQACSYFIFYSFIGCLLETGFGLWSKGVIESRQSFLFGPFCIIYGIGALLIITFLSSLKDKPIKLTTLEFDLLVLLVQNINKSFSREDILDSIWGTDYFGSDRAVDDLVRRLRKKMPLLNVNTIYGYGYRLSA